MKLIIHFLFLLKKQCIYFFKTVIIFKSCLLKKNRLILIGSPEHQNLGDHAISIAEIEFLKDEFPKYCTVEITGNHFRNGKQFIKKFINKSDIIFITGGGFIGDLWEDEEILVEDIINAFCENKIIIFPQTVYFDSDSKHFNILLNAINNCNYLTVYCRDFNSYEFIKKNFSVNVGYYPDMVLYNRVKDMGITRNGALICFRDDKECALNNRNDIIKYVESKCSVKMISTVLDSFVGINDRNKKIYDLFFTISSAKIFITDRLHAMLFSYLTKTPCIFFDNKSHKVSGVFKWIEKCNYIYYADSYESFISNFDKYFSNQEVLKCVDLSVRFKQMSSQIKMIIDL